MKLKIFTALIKLIGKLFRVNLDIKNHNGEDLLTYPEKQWMLTPFPKFKGHIYNSDNLATVNRHNFINEPKFIQAEKMAQKRWVDSNRDISWRLHTVLWAAGNALKSNIESSMMVECGTGRGFMAAAIIDYYNFSHNSPDFYLIDTFSKKLAQLDGKDTDSPAEFAYTDDANEVIEYFSKSPNVHVLKGLIPDILNDLPDKNISFLHVDLNSASAEKSALDFLANKLVSGSIVLFDDYGGYGGEDQALVHESFSIKHNQELFISPTGQSFIIWQNNL